MAPSTQLIMAGSVTKDSRWFSADVRAAMLIILAIMRNTRLREGHKTIGLNNKNNSSARPARAFYIWYISLPF